MLNCTVRLMQLMGNLHKDQQDVADSTITCERLQAASTPMRAYHYTAQPAAAMPTVKLKTMYSELSAEETTIQRPRDQCAAEAKSSNAAQHQTTSALPQSLFSQQQHRIGKMHPDGSYSCKRKPLQYLGHLLLCSNNLCIQGRALWQCTQYIA